MVMRLSNRERIRRRAIEVSLEAQEKDTPVPRRARTRSKLAVVPRRMKLVWKVFNDGFKEMACFPYPEESRAREKAILLTKKTGKAHFVNGVKVPMSETE